MIKILETTEAFHICDQGCGLGKQNFWLRLLNF
jgi:hypothetical protein